MVVYTNSLHSFLYKSENFTLFFLKLTLDIVIEISITKFNKHKFLQIIFHKSDLYHQHTVK
jgi:hypothetical protein